ncbi:hypothetical protein [Heyndrickxia oleronia]|uniref:hypothetical protein n=1 Tax=Heyndrickxia oleronia TaxID=38875 RepID=UPI001B147FF0|nr:hypothetical protein [Heyndrickxia oleronia]GIN38445.1 hypothetical protein J19TS1_13940 [Heyndrickxia oleronia]
MKNWIKGKLQSIGMVGVVVIILIGLFLGLRAYSMFLNQQGCWFIQTETLNVDLGSQPQCYTREAPLER